MKLSDAILLILLCAGCGPSGFSVSSEADASGSAGESSSSAESETSPDTETDPESETSPDVDTSGASVFLPLTDIPAVSECDPFAQDCSDGEKCVPYAANGGSWDANKCVPVMGEQAPGEACVYAGAAESTDDCDATSFCWNVQESNGEMIGTCHGFCSGTADMPMCPEGYYCPISSDGSINLCFETCDPVAQECEDGLGCYWTNGQFACVVTQEPGIADGQPCGFINDCLPGSSCTDATVIPDCMGSACCSPFCDLELGDAQCASVPGTTCEPFWEQGRAPTEYAHVGICVFEP